MSAVNSRSRAIKNEKSAQASSSAVSAAFDSANVVTAAAAPVPQVDACVDDDAAVCNVEANAVDIVGVIVIVVADANVEEEEEEKEEGARKTEEQPTTLAAARHVSAQFMSW